MTLERSWWRSSLIGLTVLTALPVLGHWARSDARPRCGWDGGVIAATSRVRIDESRDGVLEFCDVQCAREWIGRRGSRLRRIRAIDEISGVELDVDNAFFVRSAIVTNRVSGNRWHVFAKRADALRHACESRGRLCEGSEHPFARFVDSQ